MKILHLVASLESRMGGLPRAVLGMADAQARSGHEVVVAACRDSHEAHAQYDTYEVVPLPRILSPFRSSSLKKILDEMEIHWLQVHGLWEPVLHAAMRWAKSNSVPYGVTPHAMLHPWQCRHHRMSKWVLRKLCGLESLWENADSLHALTGAEAENWRGMVGDECLHIVPNGIDPESVPDDSGQPLEYLPQGPFILFLGRLAAQKNPESLLEAFARIADEFPDLYMVFAGPDFGMEPLLRRGAKAFGLSRRVFFPGLVEGREKWDLLHRCTAFCLPSRAEGFSLAVLEAGLAKAPCLISAECGFPELVQAGGAVETSTRSETLAVQLGELLRNPEELRKMGERAHQLMCDQYSWQKSAEKLNLMLTPASSPPLRKNG